MKDFFDLWLLLKDPHVSRRDFKPDAVIKTFKNRRTTIQLVGPLLDDSAERMEKEWASFRRGLSDSAKSAGPESLFDIVKALDDRMVEDGLIEVSK